MRRYNLNNKRLYESASLYEIEIDFNGRPSSLEDFGVDSASITEWKDAYDTPEDAMNAAQVAMDCIIEELGIDPDTIDSVEDDDQWRRVYSDDEDEWVFTVYEKTNECGDGCNEDDMDECNEDDTMMESVYTNRKNRRKIYEYDDPAVENRVSIRKAKSCMTQAVNDMCSVYRGDDRVMDFLYKCNFIFRDNGSKQLLTPSKTDRGFDVYVNPEILDRIYQNVDGDEALLVERIMRALEMLVRDFQRGLIKLESVSARFARLRKMFESDEEDNKTDNDETEEENEINDKDQDNDNVKNDNDDSNNDESDEEEEMKAIILTVNKGDAQKCKDELLDAGIPEEDIEIIKGDVTEGEDDDEDDNDEIRVDVNSVMELKDYLSTKGIDLEKEIGGEIISDDEESEETEDDEDNDEKSDDEEELDFDNLGDIFGAEEDEEK